MNTAVMNTAWCDSGRRADGFSERNDCTVRALAMLMDVRYSEAHEKMKSVGRKDRHGFKFSVAAKKFGLNIHPEFANRTLEKVLPEMQTGRFIVRVSRHVFAVVDGVILDIVQPKEKSRVKMVYTL